MKLEVPDGEPIGGVPVLLTERLFPSLVRVQVDDILRASASSVVQPLAWLLARLLHVAWLWVSSVWCCLISSVTDAAEHVRGRLKSKRALNFAILMIHFHQISRLNSAFIPMGSTS